MAFSTLSDPARSAAFHTRAFKVLDPQIDQTIGAPGLDSIDKILKQYSSMTRTPSGLTSAPETEFHGFEAMKSEMLFLAVKTYYSTKGGGREGPFEMKGLEGTEKKEGNGVVEMECVKLVGGVETVVAIGRFVNNMGQR